MSLSGRAPHAGFEDAKAGLLLFPGFYALVDRLLAHLRDRSKD
jgi:hypothetical protein